MKPQDDVTLIVDAAVAAVNSWGEYSGKFFGNWDRAYALYDTTILIIVGDDLTEPTPLIITQDNETLLYVRDIENTEDTLVEFSKGAWITRIFEETEGLL